jgi:hypothetical protein
MIAVMAQKIPKGIMSEKAERYFGVILEDIKGKLDFLIEGFSSLDKKFTNLEARSDRTEERLDTIELRLMDGE